MDAVIESLGWAGAAIVLGGYLLFSAGRIPNGPLYQLFNLVGALFVCVNVFAHQAWPSTIVNGIWAIIAAVVLVRMAMKHRAAKRAGAQEQAHESAHVELPTTTAVLPVIGPALVHEDHAQQELSDAPAPMTMADSVPVITAAMAIVVAAAAQEAAAQEAAHDTEHETTHEALTNDAEHLAQR